jgi:hypothetical protein
MIASGYINNPVWPRLAAETRAVTRLCMINRSHCKVGDVSDEDTGAANKTFIVQHGLMHCPSASGQSLSRSTRSAADTRIVHVIADACTTQLLAKHSPAKLTNALT